MGQSAHASQEHDDTISTYGTDRRGLGPQTDSVQILIDVCPEEGRSYEGGATELYLRCIDDFSVTSPAAMYDSNQPAKKKQPLKFCCLSPQARPLCFIGLVNIDL